jgi:hypothetical protein
MGKEERIDLAHDRALRHVDLSQTDSSAPPSVKKQFFISCFYERAWAEPIQIGDRRAGAEQCDLKIAINLGLRTGCRAKKEGQQSN